MKKVISFLLVVCILTYLFIPAMCLAEERTISFNGLDIVKFDHVVDAELVNIDGEKFYEIDCPKGAKIIVLQPCSSIYACYLDEVDVPIVPEGISEQVIDADGFYSNTPVGTTYVLNEATIYCISLIFEDGTYCDLWIYTDGLTEEDMVGEGVTSGFEVSAPVETSENVIEVMPRPQSFYIDKEPASVKTYNINGNNYMKLRDIAWLLSSYGLSDEKKFDVTWDATNNAINLISGKAYTPVGGEGIDDNEYYYAYAKPTTSTVYLNGEVVVLTAYNINDNNYFKLRDICEALDIMIEWNPQTNEISVFTQYPYGHVFEN